MISIKVPARICFFGDHQDYLGLPVIAGAINRFIELKAHPIPEKKFQIVLKDLNTSVTIGLGDSLEKVPKDDYFRSGMAVSKEKGFRFQEGFQIEISGNIPLNAGLSSSSALVVAWIRFLTSIQKNNSFSDKDIGELAYQAEVKFFDQPGGLMDQYTIAQQGLIYIDTKTGQSERLVGSLGKLVVAESGIEKQTLDVLRNARVFQEKAILEVQTSQPEFDIQTATPLEYEKYKTLVSDKYQPYWYAAIFNYHTTKKAKLLLSHPNPNLQELGFLMNQHQSILEKQIKNTPEAMKTMILSARNAGASATKIIGSGGGGSLVALVTDTIKDAVISAFLKSGAAAAYEVEIVNP